MSAVSDKVIGFLGCGKISSAVCRGYASAPVSERPREILVSNRSTEKSAMLRAEFPEIVTVCDSNDAIVKDADVIFIGLLPGVAREILPALPFTDSKLVISMMAAVDLQETLALVRIAPSRLVRTVPLPSAARRTGPVLTHPPNAEAEAVLRIVATPIVSAEEGGMKPMISVTGHISAFFELMNTSQNFLTNQGVDDNTARQFVAAFYLGCAQSAVQQGSEPFAELCEEAATPGGLNEQSWKGLLQTNHFKDHAESLGAILSRLNGKK